MEDLNKVIISVPINKVNKEQRLVSGFATTNAVDKQGDLITADASRKAFSSWQRNLREMHNPIAVGKVVDIKNDTFYDVETDTSYDGIYVTAYVSKGAQDAWEKVLDGTYSGFSIGARAKEKETVVEKGKVIRVINDMELYELSLVDVPANQFAQIVSIQKADGEISATGIVSDLNVSDIFYCEECDILSPGNDYKECFKCQSPMNNIGWLENISSGDMAEKMVKTLGEYMEKVNKEPYGDVTYADPGYQKDGQKRYPIDTEAHARAAWSYINQADNAAEYTSEQLARIKAKIVAALKKYGVEVNKMASESNDSDMADDGLHINKGGDLMEDELVVTDSVDEIVKSDDATEVVSEETIEKSAAEEVEAEDVVEKSDSETEVETVVEKSDVVEDSAVEEIVEKSDSEDLKEFISKALEGLTASQSEVVTKAIAEVTAQNEEKLEALKKEFSDALDMLKSAFEERVEGVENATAIKKSGELGGSSEHITKGVWNGAFAPKRFFDSNSIVE